MFSWYDRLSLRAKLATGLAILIGLALVVGASSVVTGGMSRAAVDRMLGQDGQIAQLSLRSVGAMLKARRYEKDFLLYYRDIGYEQADSRYAAQVRVNLAQVRDDLGRIRTLTSDPEIIEQVRVIEDSIVQYERNFLAATELIGKIGRINTGLETELADRARDIENIVAARRLDKLTIDLLTLRGHEKDYLLLGRAADAIRFRDRMAAFRKSAAQAALPAAARDSLFVLADEYLRLFEAYVEAMTKIDSAHSYYLTALQVVEPALEKLHTRASQNALDTRARVNNLTQLASILAIVISVVAVFIGLMVAIVISRSITRSIRKSMKFAENVARGDFDTRLAHHGRDEFGALAAALNGMTDALQQGRRAQEQRSAELAAANQALQNEIMERQRAERAINQLNVDLEQGVTQRTAQFEAANRELSERNREISLLSEMSRVLQTCVNVEEAYEAIPRFCLLLFPGTAGAIYMLHASRNYLQTVASWGDEAGSVPLFSPQDCWALRRAQPHWIGGPGADLTCCKHVREAGQGDAPYYCVPMMAQGETLGLVYLRFPPGQVADPDTAKQAAARQALGVTLSEQLALALANLMLRDTLRQQSIRDPLTGLFNRRYLEESMQRELARAERKAAPLALIMLDVDQFKQFNDTFGHEAGDLVLREIGLSLKGYVRGGDIACRYGGEEFTVLMPETTLATAQQRAEKLREAVRRLQLQQSGQMLGGITVSLGVAVFPEHGSTLEMLLRAADVALYEAKRAGRDQIVVAASA